MILIVDSGSTKTDWIAINNKGEILFQTQTLGLNPQVLTDYIIEERIVNNFDLYQNRKSVTKLYFYGAGCGTEPPRVMIKGVFLNIFKTAEVLVKEDTFAAIYATADINKKSIVCILGTGSNCSYFDGENVIQKITSLGYILMDDASGNYFGRQLLRDYFFVFSGKISINCFFKIWIELVIYIKIKSLNISISLHQSSQLQCG